MAASTGDEVDLYAKIAALENDDPRTDDELADAFAAGDMKAFTTVVQRHRARLLRVAARYTHGNQDDAEDVVQDALLKVSTRMDSYRAEASLTTWLQRIVMNEAYDFRHHRHRREQPTLDEDTVMLETNPALALHPHCEHDDLQVLRDALGKLHPDQQLALIAVDGQGYSVADVAAEVGVSPGTIKSRRARGRSALAQALADVGAAL